MNRFILVCFIAAVQLYAEEPVKPPAPPPGWGTTEQAAPEPKPKPKPEEGKKTFSKEDTELLDQIKLMLEEGERVRLKYIENWTARKKSNPNDKLADEQLKDLKAKKGSYIPPFHLDEGAMGQYGEQHTFNVIQIIDTGNMIVKDGDQWLWVQGVSTTGVADGDNLSGSGLFRYLGTRSYKTVLGAGKTIHCITKISNQRLEKLLEKVNEK